MPDQKPQVAEKERRAVFTGSPLFLKTSAVSSLHDAVFLTSPSKEPVMAKQVSHANCRATYHKIEICKALFSA
jgi:hypothetical protein